MKASAVKYRMISFFKGLMQVLLVQLLILLIALAVTACKYQKTDFAANAAQPDADLKMASQMENTLSPAELGMQDC